MSAQIPDTLLVSEILKPTGFDCPAKLQGKTFSEATAGDVPSVLEDNKEVTITENGTIEITPTAGHDYEGMKKVTASVSVSGGSSTATAHAWSYEYDGKTQFDYFQFGSAPANTDNWKQLLISEGVGEGISYQVADWSTAWGDAWTYTKVSDTEFTLSKDATTITYTRASAKDFTLWS